MTLQLLTTLFVFIIGIGLGITLQRYVLSSSPRTAALENELTGLKEEHSRMKMDVEHHFNQTSVLIHNLTNDYKALYDHLQKGSDSFTEKPLADLKQMLEQEGTYVRETSPEKES
ncbi:MAG: DUF1043 family protein [Oceanospirillaceae bacterium]|nr:DUF1043 family protein [Oceanospirillaceae bacterium]MCP5335944.1 DUF1043 family protein [Oceanospirillaceae bacterium]MCP5349943.1 DUF1043 family protein [Oceanospirillaceae bacterium]